MSLMSFGVSKQMIVVDLREWKDEFENFYEILKKYREGKTMWSIYNVENSIRNYVINEMKSEKKKIY